MPKFLQTPITQADLVAYLNTDSDFAFELRTVECLAGLGFQCSHGGSYEDPVTGKTRQFDIRARKSNATIALSLAVECKNLSASYPLLVMCVQRTKDECFFDALESYPPPGPTTPRARPHRVRKPTFLYQEFEPVGRNMVRVGRSAEKDNPLTASDADAFEKWSQALASAHGLADEATRAGTEQGRQIYSVIAPVLVVPDDTLWSVTYRSDGSRLADPAPTDRCSFFVGQNLSVGRDKQPVDITISHLEIVTFKGLRNISTQAFWPELLQGDIVRPT